MANDANQPARTLRYRNLKAVIWRNEGDKGPWYSVEFIRTYTEDSGANSVTYKDARTFSGDQILVVQHLAGKAFDAVAQLEAADRETAEAA